MKDHEGIIFAILHALPVFVVKYFLFGREQLSAVTSLCRKERPFLRGFVARHEPPT
jgi:hypothetical protein